MYPQKLFSNTIKITALGTGFLFLFGLILSIETASIQAADQEPTQQGVEDVPPGQEKKLGIGIRKRVPLKIKVKNANSKKWVHDFRD